MTRAATERADHGWSVDRLETLFASEAKSVVECWLLVVGWLFNE